MYTGSEGKERKAPSIHASEKWLVDKLKLGYHAEVSFYSRPAKGAAMRSFILSRKGLCSSFSKVTFVEIDIS